MANLEHVEIVKQGANEIMAWQMKNPGIALDLSRANLIAANLFVAHLCGADLSSAELVGADLSAANLSGTNLTQANLSMAVLRDTDLSGANLSGAVLGGSYLSKADLSGANVAGALLGNTSFADIDLSVVRGLESVVHGCPSTIGVDTLYRSRGKIPEAFLRGCGVPDDLVANIPALLKGMESIQFQSCFISHSSKDKEFARRLYDKMLGKKLSVYFAPEDMRGGKKIIDQIDRAIQVNDRLLLVLSESSLKSEWVKTEIRKARKAERSIERGKLFPIRLMSMDRIQEWESFYADLGEDLAAEVRSYHIPDFSNWKDHDAFEAAFADLLRDLRAEA